MKKTVLKVCDKNGKEVPYDEKMEQIIQQAEKKLSLNCIITSRKTMKD